MKIQGPNQTNFNPYKNIQKKLTQQSAGISKNDQLEISDMAKKLQDQGNIQTERKERIEKIKQAIDANEYKVNYEKTAQNG
ncbi:flagellar biosynthesis anti-sigma factor FlgM [Paracerasibacillus soli]|uniref:Flagellar biosynthesis anti-sigma factor FlgM n=1 Tax=Paracerasibacillus soli TaxID=480284 RepID=A0ABU5CRQ2_9BACI|nr:flagellar biosynthesis anti-sigma factor FlgM [Virgibacillus soli]MDY0408920.1 flagellar biosynthesis anti-sigma factor FlgM [Virgibacillus soli]